MRAARIAGSPAPPWIGEGTGDLQHVLGLLVVRLHLVPRTWPIDRITEAAARLEPFRAETRHQHREMHGAAADAASAVVRTKLDRIVAGDDAFVPPVQLLLFLLVRGEVFQGAPERSGVEGDNAKPGGGELVRERAAAGAGADDREVHHL